ncbi:hypothetical protein RSAG8_10447, partial [Rhizoctonia solani AG-8 WAC10335]
MLIDQWFVQRSGEGYRFKNVATGGYLAAIYGEDSNDRAYCGGYPTTWTLVPNPEHRGYGIYGITIGDTDRGLDLLDWGSTTDGTIHANSRTRHTASTHHWCWRFEHINDDTGEEPTSSTQTQPDLSRLETAVQAQAVEIRRLQESLLASRQEVAGVLIIWFEDPSCTVSGGQDMCITMNLGCFALSKSVV